MAFGDGKKFANALSEMIGVEDICTQILHLEGGKVFRSNKRKLDLLINFEGDFHHPTRLTSLIFGFKLNQP